MTMKLKENEMSTTTVKIEKEGKEEKVIPMSEMKPCEVGIILDADYHGNIVMRTQSSEVFEVMNLTNFKEGECWSSPKCPLKVQLLNAEITVKILED